MKACSPDTQHILASIKKKAQSKKTVFVSGNFNIVHPGHFRLLKFASECGEYLVVGVHQDKTYNLTLLDEKYRLEGVQSITWVDFGFLLKDEPEDFIRELCPAIVVKGKEHEDRYNPELEAVNSYGGKLLFSSGDSSFSLAELLKNESKRLVSSSIIKNRAFMERHEIEWPVLAKALDRFKDLNVAVIGEVIADEYINCDALGMSREDPTIVVSPADKKKFIGGAGIVAAHARTMGAATEFFSVVGEDETGRFAKIKLKEYGVNASIFEDESRPTILKQRFRSSGKTLLRVNHLRHHPLSKELQADLFGALMDRLERIDVLIFSDFNYGCLPQGLVNRIIKTCRDKNVLMVADSQSSSQIGDVSRFENMFFLSPTEREARLAVRDFESGLVVLAEKLRKKACAKNILITMDKDGLFIHAGLPASKGWETDRLDAMNPMAVDPAGAGDSFLASAALAAASGADIWQCAYIGSLAAACQVERVGNLPISIDDIRAKMMQ